MLKSKAIWSYFRSYKLLKIQSTLLFFFTFFFLMLKKITVSFRLSETEPLFTSWLTSFTFSCQLRLRGKGWQTQVTGQGELWNMRKRVRKNEIYPTEKRDASGKTTKSQLKNITRDRDEKQDTEGLTCIWNKENTFYLHIQTILLQLTLRSQNQV